MNSSKKQPPFGISVVVPTYNRVEELQRAVSSVISRDPERVEIVVVDDASMPEKWVVWPKKNASGIEIRQYRLLRNRGAQAARNFGIRRSRFRYVAFLDSDDEFKSNKIDRLLEVLRSNQIDLLFHAAEGASKYNVLAALWATHLSRWVSFRWWAAAYNPVVTPTLVVRRCVRLGLPRLRYCEDYAFVLRYCLARVRVTYLDEKLTVLHRRLGTEGGLSGATWRMRKGEFIARGILLRNWRLSNLCLYFVGSGFGAARVMADIFRLRYWR